LTDADVKTLKPPARGRLELRDAVEHGLAIRVTERGSKSWVFWYWHAESKRKCRLTLGEYPAISLASARQLASKHRSSVATGGHPAAIKQAVKQTAQVPKTIAEALALYISASG
jgi:hypothetical protein